METIVVQALDIDNSWSFQELSRTQTSYLTHGYYRYPAKFIPQLASRLILENSSKGDLVCDPFLGSGTTLVEAIVNRRHAYGTDINPVAVMISKAKTTPIEHSILQLQMENLLAHIHSRGSANSRAGDYLVNSQRIDYWFPAAQKKDLALILSRINEIDKSDTRIFFLCAFSSILKSCSRWMTKSVKPTIDKNKIPADAIKSFILQVHRMSKKNREFWALTQNQEIRCSIENGDSRKIGLDDDSTSLVVTSPPYVTSYEYADLHQLVALWLGYIDNSDIAGFRSKFMGSTQKTHFDKKPLYSKLGGQIFSDVLSTDNRAGNAVARYFAEMQQSFEEMHRILKKGGKACIVIGDTDLKKVKIRNAEVFVETMEDIGFRVSRIIKRPIPSKILPLTRDEKTGKFTSAANASRMAYPTEFILVMEK